MKTSENLTLQNCIEIAKRLTAKAKAVKAWRLRKSDIALQSLEMPNRYIIATPQEINKICQCAGLESSMPAEDRKFVWALDSSARRGFRGKVEISLAPIC